MKLCRANPHRTRVLTTLRWVKLNLGNERLTVLHRRRHLSGSGFLPAKLLLLLGIRNSRFPLPPSISLCEDGVITDTWTFRFLFPEDSLHCGDETAASNAKYTTMACVCLGPKHLGGLLCKLEQTTTTPRVYCVSSVCKRTSSSDRRMADAWRISVCQARWRPPYASNVGFCVLHRCLCLCPAGCAASHSGSCTLCVADTQLRRILQKKKIYHPNID